MSRFTADAARGLDGPDWLRQRRTAAAERFAAVALPSADEEVWRYSRIGQLDLDRYTPAGNGAAAPGAEPAAPTSPVDSADPADPVAVAGMAGLPAERSGLIVTVNGAVVRAEVASPLAVGASPDDLGRTMTQPTDAFALLNEAFLRDPVVVGVGRGAVVDRPLVIVHQVVGEGVAVFPRVVVRVGQGASLEVVELLSSADVAAFAAPVVELRVERDARLGFLTVQDLGPRVWQIASQVAEVDTQATLTSSVAAFGGEYARLRTDCRLVGRGATGNLVSLYFGDGHQMLDLRTFQDHGAPDTTSDLLFKGAVDDESHSVYTGLIRVRPPARGTNAFQTNRNIKLSEGAWAESVPNLEIENNDVRCSHASTVGPIDAEQRFYLESRGVPPPVAERLIVSGFFDEAIDRLAVPSLGGRVRARVAAKLGPGPR